MTVPFKKMTALLACAALLGSASFAQAADWQDQHQPTAQAQHRPVPQHRPAPQHRPSARQPHRAAQPAYRRGGHVPSAWRHGPSRDINNWHAYRNLHEPPRGYHWVRGDNGDALLVAVATGVIASIVVNAAAR